MAATGFILAAMEAGIIPERIPRITQILNARIMMFGAITIGKGNTALNASESSQTINKPIKPPTIQRKALSNKN